MTCSCSHPQDAHVNGIYDCLEAVGADLSSRPLFCACRRYEPGVESALPAGPVPVQERDGKRGTNLHNSRDSHAS